MPYDSVEDAEKKNPGLAKYSAKAKRGWLGAFNSCIESGKGESRCFATAYAAANQVDGKKASKGLLVVARELLAVAREVAGAGDLE